MSIEPPAPAIPAVNDISQALFAQIMRVMGIKHPGFLSRCLFPIFALPIHRLSKLAVELDCNIAAQGWVSAVKLFMGHLVTRLDVHGQENIPTTGPIMVICNHPAALDIGVLAATIPREDLKILASDIPIVQMLPHVAAHSIPVYYDIPRRLRTVRDAIRHLKHAGAIFLFPRGNVEPDPAVSPGAEQSLDTWSPSIEVFLRQVPETTSIVAVAWSMLSPGWYTNPVTQLWKKYEQRQKVAEIFQIASQLVTGRTPSATPSIRFSKPLSVNDLGGEGASDGILFSSLVAQARQMLRGIPKN